MSTATVPRVPAHTARHVNEKIRLETDRNIAYYSQQSMEDKKHKPRSP